MHCRRFYFCLLAGVLAGAAAASGQVAGAGEPRVAGLSQLVVIPPGTHERGLPAVRTEPVDAETLLVDIPPTLHVLLFYYSGDQ
jgi:hypothetical protein